MTPRRCASTHIHVHMQKPRLPWQTGVFNFDSCQRFLDKRWISIWLQKYAQERIDQTSNAFTRLT